jgi:glutaredoxin
MPNLNKPFIVYGRSGCEYCDWAIDLINHFDGWMHYYDTADWRRKEHLTNQGLKTVPQIWHDGQHIGGFDDLREYLKDA